MVQKNVCLPVLYRVEVFSGFGERFHGNQFMTSLCPIHVLFVQSAALIRAHPSFNPFFSSRQTFHHSFTKAQTTNHRGHLAPYTHHPSPWESRGTPQLWTCTSRRDGRAQTEFGERVPDDTVLRHHLSDDFSSASGGAMCVTFLTASMMAF